MSEQWINASATEDNPENDVIGIDIGGKSIALYRIEDEIFATDNLCTHGNARLCDGFLEGHKIECALHQRKFDIRNGKAMCGPLTEDVKTYPTKIEGNRVFVGM